FATARIGLILVNVNPAYRTAELEYALNRVGAKALVTARQFKTSAYVEVIRAPAGDAAPPPRELLVGPAFAGGPEHRRGALAVPAHDLGEERGKGRVDERAVGGSPDVGEAVDGCDSPASHSRLHHQFSRQSHSCSANVAP
ncbi:MAG: hypothetical protein OXC08_14240, partial [Thiotrichales bacterium]|nr:hypothetical protein [Thiotrichales bacterium]